MQSLIGTFNFACKVVTPSRTFLRRLIDLTRGVHNPNHLLRINSEARADLSAWKLFLDSINGVSLCLPVSWTSSHCIQLYSDASSLGFAAVFRKCWFQGFFPQSWAKINIAVKELLPIAIPARLWAPLMANSRIIFMCDNMSIVHVINYHTSKDTAIMRLLRQLMRGPLAQRDRRPSTSRDAALVTSAGVYIAASLAPSSRALYAKSLLRLQQFALSSSTPHSWLPASIALICIFRTCPGHGLFVPFSDFLFPQAVQRPRPNHLLSCKAYNAGRTQATAII